MPPTNQTTPPTAKRILILGLLAWASYVGFRFVIQGLLPVHDWRSYLEQDLAVTVGRLSLGLYCLWLGRLRYDARAYWNQPGRMGLAWLLGFGLVLPHVIAVAHLPSSPWALDLAHVRAIEVVIALVVAFNEEIGFRATLFEPLRELWGKAGALLGSTVFFAFMHTGYQAWWTLPRIALTGLAFGLARLCGVSLGQLIAIHFAIDAAIALYLPGQGQSNWMNESIAAASLAIICGLLWHQLRLREKA